MIKANEQPILVNEEYLYRSESYKELSPEIVNENEKN